jgi:hypothetical protein
MPRLNARVTAKSEILQVEDDAENEDEDERRCLWSGWRGFGAGGVDWWLEYRRTGCNCESVTLNKLNGRPLRGMVNQAQSAKLKL